MRDDTEAPTRSQVTGGLGVDLGPRALVFWDGGQVSMGLPEQGKLTVGRSKTCELRIDHPSVSRTHVALHVETAVELRIQVEDLGSSNGTRVNGSRMEAMSRVPLAAGDVVEIGSAILVVQGAGGIGGAPTVPPPARAPEPRSGRAPIVASDPMRRLYRMVDLVAASRIGVLIVGETGVGKELLAEAVHQRSPRAGGPFVRVNCAAMPENLLESEMFGFEKGAFTGAVQAKPGVLEAANGGTLFLDEVGDLGLATQAKILRAIEAGEVTRVGSVKPRPIDVRFVSATNQPLVALVEQGAFRRDLYYRLDGITLAVPPLRERTDDVLPLAEAFARAAAAERGIVTPTIGPEARALLMRHSWPGNIRELRNAVERACLLADGGTIAPAHLRLGDAAGGDAGPARPTPTDKSLSADVEALERTRILDALDRTGGNQTRAAELLGISRRTLVNRIEEWGLPRPRKGSSSRDD